MLDCSVDYFPGTQSMRVAGLPLEGWIPSRGMITVASVVVSWPPLLSGGSSLLLSSLFTWGKPIVSAVDFSCPGSV